MTAFNEPQATVSASEDRTIAIISYLTLIGFLVAVVLHNGKKTQIGSFHLRQALGLMLTAVACWPVNIFLAFIPFLGWLCMILLLLTLFVFWIMGFMAALNGQMKPVPVVGEYYQKWFANAFT